MGIKCSNAAKRAIQIGSLCSISYLAVYICRNILGSVSPQLIESGSFTTENIGTLSSIFFIAYAIGQLINGMIGDRINAKYMISFGLMLAGVFNLLFTVSTGDLLLVYIEYGMTGFFLSMIYAPMTKVVAENTEPLYATRCSLGYTFASFLGAPLAGVLAAFLIWQSVFSVSGILLILMGACCFAVFTFFEKRRIVAYNRFGAKKENGGGIKALLANHIIKFTFVSIITGVVRTTVIFWLPTYISQHLLFSSENSAIIFTVATFVISMSTFVAVFLYEWLGRNMELTIFISFCSAAVCFLFVFMCKQPILNIVFLVLAILSSNCAATMLWSRYCPSLRDTGMVSSATGYLDFMSYMAASVSSTIFANAVAVIGWSKLILIWFALMIFGIVVALPNTFSKKYIELMDKGFR